uniref:Mannose-P-dolichol utilization defect 1 protein homolog n=1 Tax=Photinus pyralis TaxID=7054 RepID=A0A1Y1NKW7_PHOPY
MDLFRKVTSIVLTPECYDEYFVEFNFFSAPCFKTTLSKCLGVVLILGAVLVKVPQIIKIFKSKSAVGISISSVTLDLVAITIFLSYSFVKGFPFTSYGDALFLAIQTLIVGVLVLYYSGSPSNATIYTIGYLITCFIMMSGITPIGILWTLQGFNIPILLTGKLTQAYTNYKNGTTGQLSAVTLIMLFGGSLARIFTSIQETGDFMIILTYLVSSSANFVLVFQLWYYWDVELSKKKEK